MNNNDLLTSVTGGLGIITLNRPKAVNALNHNMIGLLDDALTEFEHNDDVLAVLVRGAGDRGLCSGGDVVSLHKNAVENDLLGAAAFFRDEYVLDHRISVYPKPYIVIMNGLVLGGGVGIAVPGSHRVATDSTRLGMPEVGIGFSPDVGGAYYLANAPGSLGNYMALTGSHVSGADTVFANMADVLVPDANIDDLVESLSGITNVNQIDGILAQFHEPATSVLETEFAWIDQAFGKATAEEILTAVRTIADDGNELASKALKALQRNSPLSMKVALEAIRRARDLSLAETLVQDLRTTMNAIAGDEFIEGIRAQLIDKDRNPQWNPARLVDVTADDVAGFFAPVDGIDELVIDDVRTKL